MKKKVPCPTAQAEDSALSRFCQSIQHDEISFDTWESCMTVLNLSVPVFVTVAEAEAGAEKTVAFTRTVTTKADEKPHKESAKVQVTIPPKAADGLQLKCSALGDVRCDARGDLLVIVRIKR